MAPEFFGCFLAFGLLAVCVVLGVLALLPRRFGTRKLGLLGLAPAAVLLIFFLLHLRQQFFLNEPMAIAAHQGKIDEVRRLLDRGASPDSWGVDCVDTALTGAANGGHADIVRLLLDRGANPNLANAQGRTALFYATVHRNTQIEQTLLKAGAEKISPP
jgi:ankyrin repeat protein